MISSINNAHARYANQTAQPAPKTQAQQSNDLPQDTVSLKSTGDVDHDVDSK